MFMSVLINGAVHRSIAFRINMIHIFLGCQSLFGTYGCFSSGPSAFKDDDQQDDESQEEGCNRHSHVFRE